MAIAFNTSFIGNFPAVAAKVEVSGGGQCEGDITQVNLNSKVVCTYGNGDRYEGISSDGQLNGSAMCDYKSDDTYEGELKGGQKHDVGVYISRHKSLYHNLFSPNIDKI